MSSEKKLKVKLVRSINGTLPSHKATVKGLGLRRMHHTVIVPSNACTRGMVKKIEYLLSVEEV
jgi:large subunit ribosomal protein L30